MTTAGESSRRPPLARTLDGSPFVVTVDACAWRIRRWRVPGARGAPELVYGEDALPLEIPIDTAVGEFRELVGNRPGRYRLDAVDADGVDVPKAGPAYLQIDPPDATRNASHVSAVPVDPTLEALREVLRTNAELARTAADLARTVIEKFPAMIESSATLVRAADGAGLPQRTPTDARNAQPAAVDDDDRDDEPTDGESWATTARHVADQVLPLVKFWLTSRPRNAAAPDESKVPPATTPIRTRRAAAPAAPAAPAPETDAQNLAPTADQLAHFAAIQIELTPRERQIAQAIVVELGPVEVAAWFRELCARSVPDAVAVIRQHLAASAPAPTNEAAELDVRDPDILSRAA